MNVQLELVIRVNNLQLWSHILLYLASRLTTVSIDIITNMISLSLGHLFILPSTHFQKGSQVTN